MSITVRIPTPLRRVTNGEEKVTVEGSNLNEIIGSLDDQYPGIKARICNDQGDLRNFVNVYVNGEDVRFLEGLQTATKTGDEISIVPAVAGGSGERFVGSYRVGEMDTPRRRGIPFALTRFSIASASRATSASVRAWSFRRAA